MSFLGYVYLPNLMPGERMPVVLHPRAYQQIFERQPKDADRWARIVRHWETKHALKLS